ncbi:MAG: lipopolysaccharide kinase InaA family protein [Gammaproteobacteria bacterium]|nr:lipopolysaccharide kinase InaA family protein [Gammaproteobacteria bacterium]
MPTTDVAALRRAGRSPTLPLQLALDDGRMLSIDKLLRVLPGKRLTGIGTLDGQTVLAKLFIAKPGAERHWERERQGLTALLDRGIATPRLLGAGRLADDGHYLLTEYIAGAHAPSTLDEAELLPVFRALGRMHAHGLIHRDAHPGNFLIGNGTTYIIDGDAIRGTETPRAIRENLALLLAQLPQDREARMRASLLSAYQAENGAAPLVPAQLDDAVDKARARRLDDYLGKCLRNCSLFHVEKHWDRFIAVPRDEIGFLAPLVAAPDRWMAGGTPLKQGRTATLALIELGGRKLVIKRYNIKGPGHALSRGWRPSRAWHSWVEAHRLSFLGIATPRPLALIENRIGPLRGRAWLVTEYCPGPDLLRRCALAPLGDDAMRALSDLFRRLFAARISHGDLKATNLLWQGDRPVLIDLDAMRQHTTSSGFQRAWNKDRARFLRNWPENSALHGRFDAMLPRA